MMKTLLSITCGIVASAALSAQATVFMADTFSYPDGQLTITDLNGSPGDDVSGGNWVAHSGDTFSDNIDVVNGAAQVLASGSEDANRGTGVDMQAGDVWYYAANVTVNDTRFSPALALNEDYFMHFWGPGFAFLGRTFILEPNTFSTDTFTFGVAASSDNGSPPAKWATDLDFGTEYTIVQEYDFDSGNVRLWVDPVDINSTSITDTNPNPNSVARSINALALRQDFVGGAANNEVLVNDVSIGDDFSEVLAALGTDVAPGGSNPDIDGDGDIDGSDFLQIQRDDASLIPDWQAGYPSPVSGLNAVPEPTSMALVGLAIAALPLARRK